MKNKALFLFICILTSLGISTAYAQPAPPPPPEKPVLYFPNEGPPVKITPSAGPRVNGSWNVYLTGEFIYWTVRQDGMFYAVSGAGANPSKGSVHDLDWEWEPGFKVGLGVNLPHDGWDLYAKYTWIQSSTSDSTSQAAATTTLTPYWVPTTVDFGFLSHARASWDIHFNDVNLELGRNSYLSQYFKVRIHAGLKGSWIDQDYNVHYTYAADGSRARIRQSQDFWGVGIRAGLNNSWQFLYNFCFYGDLALSILWGQFDLDRNDQYTPAGNVAVTTLHTGVSPHTFEPVLELGAGFRWDLWFGNGDYHFSLQAGWEHQLWILQNELIKGLGEPDHIGDLVLQGLTVKARFDF